MPLDLQSECLRGAAPFKKRSAARSCTVLAADERHIAHNRAMEPRTSTIPPFPAQRERRMAGGITGVGYSECRLMPPSRADHKSERGSDETSRLWVNRQYDGELCPKTMCLSARAKRTIRATKRPGELQIPRTDSYAVFFCVVAEGTVGHLQ